MSDPVTNVEIEDVLTSIRRLVSENASANSTVSAKDTAKLSATAPAKAPAKMSASVPAMDSAKTAETASEVSAPSGAPRAQQPQISPDDKPRPEPRGKLVLTPALRVVGAEPLVATTEAEHQEDADEEDASLAATLSFLHSARAKDTPASGQVSSDAFAAASEGSDPLASSREEDDRAATAGRAADIFAADSTAASENLAEDPADDLADDVADVIVDDTAPDTADTGAAKPQTPVKERGLFDPDEGITLSEAQSLEARLVQWEHMSEADILAYEPDAPGDSDYAGTEIASLSWAEALAKAQGRLRVETDSPVSPSELSPSGVDAAVGGDHDPDPAQNRDQVQDAPETLVAEPDHEDAIAPMFTASRRVDLDQPNADARSDGPQDMAQTMFSDLREQVDAEVHKAFGEAMQRASFPALQGDDPAEDSVLLDETMLRELVSDIVRQELQGALGERITRNVRKLVRREIHRALAAHDLN